MEVRRMMIISSSAIQNSCRARQQQEKGNKTNMEETMSSSPLPLFASHSKEDDRSSNLQAENTLIFAVTLLHGK